MDVIEAGIVAGGVLKRKCELLPERVLGSAGAFWMKSGVAIGPIFSLTEIKEDTKAFTDKCGIDMLIFLQTY